MPLAIYGQAGWQIQLGLAACSFGVAPGVAGYGIRRARRDFAYAVVLVVRYVHGTRSIYCDAVGVVEKDLSSSLSSLEWPPSTAAAALRWSSETGEN
jgi:hypothetical protein